MTFEISTVMKIHLSTVTVGAIAIVMVFPDVMGIAIAGVVGNATYALFTQRTSQ